MANTLSPRKIVSFLRSCKNKQLHPNGKKKKQRLYLFRTHYNKGVSNHHLYLVETQMQARESFITTKTGRLQVCSDWKLLAWASGGRLNRSGVSCVVSLENMFGFLTGLDLETEAKNRDAGTHRPSLDHSGLMATDYESDFSCHKQSDHCPFVGHFLSLPISSVTLLQNVDQFRKG